MRKITLIGMMGSGKTTIGKILSEQTGISAIDLDNFIENKENESISEIFKTKGEQYFRTVEANTIKELTQTTSSQILSLGGGTFENEQTRELLLKNSTVIYLETTPEEIFKRIKKTNNRPLLKNNMTIEKISEIMTKRKNNYNLAHHKILTDGKTPSKIAEEILGALEWKN